MGSAPILRKAKFRIAASDQFYTVITFLRKHLELDDAASLFLYLSGAFSPTPTQLLGDLFALFGAGDELVVNYSLTNSYG